LKQHTCPRLLYLFSLTLFQSFVKWNSHSKSIINNDSHLLTTTLNSANPLWNGILIIQKSIIDNDSHLLQPMDSTTFQNSEMFTTNMSSEI
jgi:hypothetical protein